MKKILLSKTSKVSIKHYALVDDDLYDWLNRWNWTYIKSHGGGQGAYRKEWPSNKTIYMHRIITNAPKGMDVDHKDHDGLNNRRSNLRVCTHSQNLANRTHKNNKSGFKGVSWDSERNKWLMQIKCGDLRISTRFETLEEAAKAYNIKAQELFGEFAMLNSLA